MAKRKIEEYVYLAAPLVITKDRFIELLTAQIEKGKELLDINVPVATFNDPYMGYARRPVESMEYDEAAEKNFLLSSSVGMIGIKRFIALHSQCQIAFTFMITKWQLFIIWFMMTQ